MTKYVRNQLPTPKYPMLAIKQRSIGPKLGILASARIELEILGTFLFVSLLLVIIILKNLKSELLRLSLSRRKKDFENRTIYIFELGPRHLPQNDQGRIWVIHFLLEWSKSKDS